MDTKLPPKLPHTLILIRNCCRRSCGIVLRLFLGLRRMSNRGSEIAQRTVKEHPQSTATILRHDPDGTHSVALLRGRGDPRHKNVPIHPCTIANITTGKRIAREFAVNCRVHRIIIIVTRLPSECLKCGLKTIKGCDEFTVKFHFLSHNEPYFFSTQP